LTIEPTFLFMPLPQIQILQFDRELCRWDTKLMDAPHARFKFFDSLDSMYHYANIWLTATANEPGVIFLCGHGMNSRFISHSKIIRIDELLKEIGPLNKKSVHFSSCYTFNTENKKLKKIYEESGAHIISGYRESVNAIDSANLESFLLSHLGHPIQSEYTVTKAYSALYRVKSETVRKTGFCFVSRIIPDE